MPVPYKEYDVIKTADNPGMVVLTPETINPNRQYPIIFFHHGIGERGDGSIVTLDKLRIWGGLDGLEAGIKYWEFFLVELQTDSNWQHGETMGALNWAKKTFSQQVNFNKSYITGLSLGGGGTQRFLTEHADSDKYFAAASIMCPGPNQYFVIPSNFKNMANLKLPMWFFHASDDKVVTPDQSTNISVNTIRSLNPNVKVFRTLPNIGGHFGGWKPYNYFQRGTPAATVDNSTDFNNPKMNIYQFFLSNEIGKAAVTPDQVFIEPITTTSPIIISTTVPIITTTAAPLITSTSSTTIPIIMTTTTTAPVTTSTSTSTTNTTTNTTTMTTTTPVTTTSHISTTTSLPFNNINQKEIKSILAYADNLQANHPMFEITFVDNTTLKLPVDALRLRSAWISLRNGKMHMGMARSDGSSFNVGPER